MLSEANMILTSCECRGTLWKLLASASSPPPPFLRTPSSVSVLMASHGSPHSTCGPRSCLARPGLYASCRNLAPICLKSHNVNSYIHIKIIMGKIVKAFLFVCFSK